MINDGDGPLEEEIVGVAVHLPSAKAIVPKVTMDSPRGEEEIDIGVVQRKEQLVILGDQSIPILEWLRQRIQLCQQREVDPAIELQEILDRSNRLEEQGKARRYTKFIRGELGSRILQIVTPTVDKGKNQIALDEYHVTEINLGRASREKILEDFDDST